MRLAVLTSHPIQYYAPLFRQLASRIDLEVLYAHRPTAGQQGASGFGTSFEWDVDLLSGYSYRFLRNVSPAPSLDTFGGCDTPEIDTAIRSGRFDALLVTGWHMTAYVQGIVAAKRAGIPVLVRGDSHLTTPRSAAKRLAKILLYPALLRLFDAALYVGDLSRSYYVHYRYPGDRLFKVPHCVDTAWFAAEANRDAGLALRARHGIPESESVVLFAGKLVDFKRPLDVAEAVARVGSERPVSLMVAGAGPLQDQLTARARELGVKLHSLGFCNQSQMPAVYAASQALVLPSTGRETWGLVCNEAIACGTPIVVSDAVGCAPDLAGPGRAGPIFPLGDVDGCAQSITEILQAPPPVEVMERISNEYSIAAAVAGIEEALGVVTSRRKRIR